MSDLPVELWPVQATTGWGTFGYGLAIGLARLGRRVIIPPPTDLGAFPKTIRPVLGSMLGDVNDKEHRIAIVPYGMHWPKYIERPNRTQVLMYMSEDTALPDHAVENIKKYALVLAPSRWAQAVL